MQMNFQEFPVRIDSVSYHVNMKIFNFMSFAQHENDVIKAVMQQEEFLGICDKEIELFSV